jgi:hypothetical protein
LRLECKVSKRTLCKETVFSFAIYLFILIDAFELVGPKHNKKKKYIYSSKKRVKDEKCIGVFSWILGMGARYIVFLIFISCLLRLT